MRTPRIVAVAAISIAALTLSVAPVEAAPSPLTLHTGTKRTAVIKPTLVSAPSGAFIVSKTITVKQNGRLLIRGVSKIRAPRGKYKVTSRLVYRPRNVSVVADIASVSCRVSNTWIIDDRTDYDDGGGFISPYLSGQVTLGYSGYCSGNYMSDYAPTGTFWGSWTADEWVATEVDPDPATWPAAILAQANYGFGDVTYEAIPRTRAKVSYGTSATKVSTRKVRVVR